MGFQHNNDGPTGSPYRPVIVTAIRPGILLPAGPAGQPGQAVRYKRPPKKRKPAA